MKSVSWSKGFKGRCRNRFVPNHWYMLAAVTPPPTRRLAERTRLRRFTRVSAENRRPFLGKAIKARSRGHIVQTRKPFFCRVAVRLRISDGNSPTCATEQPDSDSTPIASSAAFFAIRWASSSSALSLFCPPWVNVSVSGLTSTKTERSLVESLSERGVTGT